MTFQTGLSFLAGLLTVLSPCVLPILPFLFGSALRKNKMAPFVMILGLASSFLLVGFTISRFGSLLGLDSDQMKSGSAILLIVTSLFFLSKRLQTFVSERLASVANQGNLASTRWKLDESSLFDSLILGVLLGVIWSPCAGPTLGVAISLAAEKNAAGEAFWLLSVYALGAALPMLMISYGLRSVFQKYQARFLSIAENSKPILGVILLLTGLMIFFGYDKVIEAFLLERLPSTWVDLITNY